MRKVSSSPIISQLPIIAQGRSGWPWNEMSVTRSGQEKVYFSWPSVSIVTPSFNQVQFLEETIRSVLLQGYPNLEYIIIDGGSTDGSVEIIKKYESWLAYWVSEPDQGQSHAINKGFERATGEIVAWLNSDDTYEPGAITIAVQALLAYPSASLVYADCHLIDDHDKHIDTWYTHQADVEMLLLEGNQIPQQTVFMRRPALIKAGGVDPVLHWVMDHELWIRMGRIGPLVYTNNITANFRFHSESKTMTRGAIADWEEWLQVLAQMRDRREAEPALLEEAMRRTQIHLTLENVFIGDLQAALQHLQMAVEDGVWPYGSSRMLAEHALGFEGISRHKLVDTPDFMSGWLRVVSQLNNRRQARQLTTAIKSLNNFRHVFLGYAERDWRRIRNHIWRGLALDPFWLANRGVWSILAQSYFPKNIIRKSRT